MALPKFILGDNSDFKEAIYVIHTEYPRFIINLEDDSVTWFDDLDKENEAEITDEVAHLIEEATNFFDRETKIILSEK